MLHGAVVFTVLATIASCGSRTGLFGPDLSELIDADIDLPDATVDARRDARADAPTDAPIDVIDEPVGCIPGKFTFTLATPQLMFVLDRSGSMNFLLNTNVEAPPGQPSRWTVLASSLSQTITPFSNQIAMGARFFPVASADPFDPVIACMQDPPSAGIPPALDNVAAILDVFAKTTPVGGTPSATALQQAAQQLSSSRAVARAMVIATDGAPNCNAALDPRTCTCTSTDPSACRRSGADGTNCLDDTRTVMTIRNIFDVRKIPVYVIGIGVIGGFATTLDAMSVAGGRPRTASPRYFPAETPAELTSAFTVVRDSVAKCSYITPSSPQDPNAIAVDINGMLVMRDPTHTDGWDWIDQEYGHLQLFGPACDQASPTNVSGTVTCDAPDQ